MGTISRLAEQKRRGNRVSVYLDGTFAFGCNKRVAERFGLKVGKELSPEDLESIARGEVRQECFDKAMDYLSRRMHGREELRRKLRRGEFPEETIEVTLTRLQELKYLDDAEFARQKLEQGQRKMMGQRRVMADLLRSGISGGVAREAVREHFQDDKAKENARLLIDKNMPRLLRLDRVTARRRLVGLLQRRGFAYEEIKDLVARYFTGEAEDQIAD